MKEKIFAIALMVLMLGMGVVYQEVWRAQLKAASRTFQYSLAAPSLLFYQMTFAALFLLIAWYVLVKNPANLLTPATYLIVSGIILTYFLGIFVPPLYFVYDLLPRGLFAPYIQNFSFAIESASFLFVIGILALARRLRLLNQTKTERNPLPSVLSSQS